MGGVGQGPRLGRRRAVGGLLAVGAASMLAACESRIKLPSPLSTPALPRKIQPLAPKQSPTEPETRLLVDFGRVVRLEGVTIDEDTVRAGGYLRLWLHWLALETAPEDLRSIGQLVGDQGRLVAKEDDQIGGRRRLLTRWQPGERYVDEMRLRIAPNTPAGEHALAVGVLRPDNQSHVPISGRPADVAIWREDEVLVGTVEIVTG